MSEAPYVRVRDDGVVEYRASSLGGCDLALLAARLDYDAIPLKAESPMMKVFDRGQRIEKEILAADRNIEDRQQEILVELTGRLHVVGHVDGFDYKYGTVVEIKSQNKASWDDFNKFHWSAGIFPRYKWQVSCYMHAYHRPLKLIRVLVDENGYAVDRDDSYIDEPFYTIPQIRARVLRVEAAAATGVLNAECTPMFPCPYFYLHENIDRELIDDESLDALAREYAHAGAAEKAAGGRKAAARRALREASEQDRYRTKSGVQVTFFISKNPPKLDTDILEPFLNRYGKSLDDFQTRSEGERLKVTLPKEIVDDND